MSPLLVGVFVLIGALGGYGLVRLVQDVRGIL